MFLGPIPVRLAEGVEWDRWWFVWILMICFLAWSWNHSMTTPGHYIPEDVSDHAPREAIANMMEQIEEQGYIVILARDFNQDQHHRNRLIVEYVVKTLDESNEWSYKWAWRVPRQLVTPDLTAWSNYPLILNPDFAEYRSIRSDEVQFNSYLRECVLIPLSGKAISIQDTLDLYIAATD